MVPCFGDCGTDTSSTTATSHQVVWVYYDLAGTGDPYDSWTTCGPPMNQEEFVIHNVHDDDVDVDLQPVRRQPEYVQLLYWFYNDVPLPCRAYVEPAFMVKVRPRAPPKGVVPCHV